MPNLTIGIIGTGGIAQQVHLPVLAKMHEFTVRWVCDLNTERATVVAKRFRVPAVYSSVDDCPDVDAVLIATPVGSRRRLLAAVAERGWHAFCEKPFAATFTEHAAMLDAADVRRLVLSCGYMRRFYHSTIAAREFLQSVPQDGPLQVLASDCSRLRRNPHSEGWYLTDAKSGGGGFLMETGSHLVDQALNILGNPHFALTGVRQTYLEGIDYETTALGTSTLTDGREVNLSLAVSRLRDMWTGLRISSSTLDMDIPLSPGRAVSVTNRRSGAAFQIAAPLKAEFDLTNAHVAQLSAFARRIDHGDWESNSEATGIEVTALLTHCYAESQKQQVVKVAN